MTLIGIREGEHAARDVVRYGCGMPILGALLQAAVSLLHLGINEGIAWLGL